MLGRPRPSTKVLVIPDSGQRTPAPEAPIRGAEYSSPSKWAYLRSDGTHLGDGTRQILCRPELPQVDGASGA